MTNARLNRRIGIILFILFALLLIGTAGYVLIEGWSWVDGLYMTVITIGTVGFGEVNELSQAGRLFTIALIMCGVGTVATGLGTIVDYLITAQLGGDIRRRRLMQTLDRLDHHIIVCGYGRVGKEAAEALQQNGQTVAIIDEREEVIELARAAGMLAIVGDATHDDMLKLAHIERADGLMVCSGSDTINLYIVLSARALNPDLMIVARTVMPESEAKMRRAGADQVVSPYRIGGHRMANIYLRPHVADFLEQLTLNSRQSLWIEEMRVMEGSKLEQMTLGESDLRRRTGVTLLGILRGDIGLLQIEAATRFEAHDRLIAVGAREQLAALEALVKRGEA